jgi:hypothetical protein
MKISPGWLKQLQKILTNFFVSEVFIFHDDNLSVTHVFIQQIFRAVEVAPPPLPPPLTRLGWGWGRSGFFQPQAVALVMAMKQ